MAHVRRGGGEEEGVGGKGRKEGVEKEKEKERKRSYVENA
jgi:hypothetical protein